MTAGEGRCPACKTVLAADSRFCHRCGLPLSGERPRPARPPGVSTARLLVVISCLVWVGGWMGCTGDAETFTVAGFISTLLGLAMIALGQLGGYGWAMRLGVAHCCMFGFCVVLIAMFGWSPAESQRPFLLLGAIYLVGMVPFSVHAFRQAPAATHPWMCQRCGYLLRGLDQARCPECGLPFDPERSRAVNPP